MKRVFDTLADLNGLGVTMLLVTSLIAVRSSPPSERYRPRCFIVDSEPAIQRISRLFLGGANEDRRR